MNKRTILSACLLIATTCTIGCSKTTCSCQEFDADSGALVGAQTVKPEDYNATTCSGIEVNLRTATQGDFIYRCSEV
ncbi:MAG: hypothetical protein IJV22_05555 [Bacteroidales bacterium]|nr:hypothetical protein [Bacteroidales bacterium]